MAIEFNGSRKDKELEALDILLKGKSDEYKGRVLQYVRDAKVDANDSTFILMVALGNLDIALVDLPKAITIGQQGMSEEIKRVESEFGKLWRTAIAALKVEIEDVKTLHQSRDLTATTRERELDRKIAVVQKAMSDLDTNIKALEGIESRVKANYAGLARGLVEYKQELATGLNRLAQRDAIKVWDYDKWRAEHWLLFLGTFFLMLLVCIDSWRVHSELNQISDQLERVLTNVGYNATKLGRIEKHLGIRRPKDE
jgi:ribosomal protein S9